MRILIAAATIVAAGLLAPPAAAQPDPQGVIQPPALVEGDNVVLRGCVTVAPSHEARRRSGE